MFLQYCRLLNSVMLNHLS